MPRVRLSATLVLLCGLAVGAEPIGSATAASASAADEAVPASLAPLRERLLRLELERRLMEAESARPLAPLQAEAARLEAELRLVQQKLKVRTLEQDAKRAQIEAASELAKKEAEAELLPQRVANERRKLEQEEASIKAKQSELEGEIQKNRNAVIMAELQVEAARRANDRDMAKAELEAINLQLETAAKRRAAQAVVAALPERPADPFQNGVLTISDRRIPLEGAIIPGTADWVCNRIDYYNNRGNEPIFIVIGYCPGGSVMEGYRILRTMAASKAPVHVVVKGFAASMAAVITTDATHSYCLPNAIILHHQPSSFAQGNLAETKEHTKLLGEWARRLHTRTAEKMGLTLDDFYKRMYERAVTGDWQEFGDEAVRLKWADRIVTEIREAGISVQPTDDPPRPWWWRFFNDGQAPQSAVSQDIDERVRLPALRAFDAYFIYNSDQRYWWK
jgi:ATP-dependent Clp protease protease subunit